MVRVADCLEFYGVMYGSYVDVAKRFCFSGCAAGDCAVLLHHDVYSRAKGQHHFAVP